MSFSPEWLALREPVDHRSRDRGLATRLAAALAPRSGLEIVDLGCGTGSNLRATAPHLGPDQHWTLVDWDAVLLEAAAERIAAWADTANRAPGGGDLTLVKDGRRLVVSFRRADIAGDLDGALGPRADLVTASALFDLVSGPFIGQLASAVAARSAAFYTVLTYDGVQEWTPPHAADAAMRAAFHRDQQRDKGFGAAAGPDAPARLAEVFRTAGYAVAEASTPWVLGAPDRGLIADLAEGYAAAVRSTGIVSETTVADWLAVSRTGAVVGHIDTLALPRG